MVLLQCSAKPQFHPSWVWGGIMGPTIPQGVARVNIFSQEGARGLLDYIEEARKAETGSRRMRKAADMLPVEKRLK